MTSLAPAHRLVVASAGTGKTYRLTVELLRRLRGGATPAELLATTFTRKAAGEILERLLVRLAEASLDPAARRLLGEDLSVAAVAGQADPAAPVLSAEQCHHLLSTVAGSLDRLQISTLDAFFHRMLASFRVELGFTAMPAVLPPEDPRAVELERRALDQMLEEMAAGDFDELLGLLDRLRDGRARRPVVHDLARLLGEIHRVLREAPDPATWPATLGGSPDADHPERLVEALGELGLHPMPKAARAAWRRDLAQATAGAWRDFLADGLAAKVLAQDRQYRNFRLPPGIVAAYRPLVDHARRVLLGRVVARTVATRELIALYDRCYAEQMRAGGVILFDDVAFRLAHELPALHRERVEEVYYRLDGAVSHLLVDEFQDTSLDQWRVLAPFAEEIWSYGDGTRSFFCVGDPKQAIYGWRGGCAELFGLVAERLAALGSEVETLTVNYRSAPLLLEVVSTVFAGLLRGPAFDWTRAAREWLDGFPAVEAAFPERQGHLVLEIVETAAATEDSPDDGGERPLYAAVLEQVRELLAGRPEARIGVLVRTNRTASALLDVLRRHGVEASGEGGSSLVDDPAVTVVLAALQLSVQPGDRAAAFHVASSPLAGDLGLSTIEDGPAVSRALRERLQAEGLPRLLADLGTRLAPSVDRKSAVRLTQLLELARRFTASGGGGRSVADFVSFARTTRREDPQLAPVRVMTVHRSKGLEFDAVVLCELERRPATPAERMVWVQRPAPAAPPSSVVRSVDAETRRLDPSLEQAYLQELGRLQRDDLSALYVALTRARHALSLVIELPARETGSSAVSLPSGSWGALLVSSLATGALSLEGTAALDPITPAAGRWEAGAPDWCPERAAARTGASAANDTTEDNVAKGDGPSARAAQRRTAKEAGPSRPGRRLFGPVRPAPSDPGDPLEWLRLDAGQERQRGLLLHAWLALVEFLPEHGDGDSSLFDEARMLALGRSVAPGADPSWLATTYRRWLELLRSPGVRSALVAPPSGDGERLVLWRERSYAVELAGRLAVGRFDRTVVLRDADGKARRAWLWDFKSESGEALDGAVHGDDWRPAERRHFDQLAAYRDALGRLVGLEPGAIAARLVFVDRGRSLPLPSPWPRSAS